MQDAGLPKPKSRAEGQYYTWVGKCAMSSFGIGTSLGVSNFERAYLFSLHIYEILPNMAELILSELLNQSKYPNSLIMI